MTEAYKYKAFISYSHRDRAHADKLFRALESYRVPRRLVGMRSDKGDTIHTRVGQLFRDRDELPAAEDLNAEVKKALTQSEFMIVLCSPAAAASRWVNREIIEFKKLTGERRILSVILSGEPFASDHGRPENECFPPALRYKLSEGGTIAQERAEPLAADLRPEGDGERRGLLKLVAGLMGIGLDALIERDLQRKMRRVMAVTAASVAAMLGMGMLTYEAVTARQEAERARNEAEGLIEYMLTDLRQTLFSVGRIDVMAKVNEQAMEYYEHQGDPEKLSAESRERRARILRAMGVDDDGLGNQDAARAKFKEYLRTARDLWEEDPENPERIYAYSVGIHQLGYADYTDENLEEALPQFKKALEVLQPIVGPDSQNGRYLRQAALLNSSLCATYVKRNHNLDDAGVFCRDTIQLGERLIALEPQNPKLRYEQNFYVSWLGEWLAVTGNDEEALAKIRESLELSNRLVSREPQNKRWREQNIELSRRYAKHLSLQSKSGEALKYLLTARETAQRLVKADPSNSYWASLLADLNTLIQKEQNNGGS